MKPKIKLKNETKFGTKQFKHELAFAKKAREIVEAWNADATPGFFNGLKDEMRKLLETER